MKNQPSCMMKFLKNGNASADDISVGTPSMLDTAPPHRMITKQATAAMMNSRVSRILPEKPFSVAFETFRF